MKKPSYLILLILYVIVLCVIVLLLHTILDRRSNESVYFEGYVHSISLPEADTISIPLLSSLHLRGFDAEISQINSGILETGREKIKIPGPSISITVNDKRNTDPVSILASPGGKLGDGSVLTIPAGSRIGGDLPNGDAGIIMIGTPRGKAASLRLQTEELRLPELNRLIPKLEFSESLRNNESFSLDIIPSGGRLIKAEFTSLEDSNAKTARLYLRDKEKAFIPGRETIMFSQQGLLTLTGSIDPILKVDALDAPGQPKGLPLEIKMQTTEAIVSFTALDLNEQKTSWMLKLKIKAEASSLLVENHELVQTRFEKIMNGKMSEKSIWGIGVLALTFVIVSFFKKAIERIVDEVLARKEKRQ